MLETVVMQPWTDRNDAEDSWPVVGIEGAGTSSAAEAAAYAYVPRDGRWIEALALPGEDPAELRRVLDDFLAHYRLDSPGTAALVEQATMAEIERRRALQSRADAAAARVRTAVLDFDRAQEDEVETYRAMLPKQ